MKKNTSDFLQVTRGYVKEMRELAKRSPAAHQVLWLLAERMNRTNAVVISQKTMGQILGYSRATLNRAVTLLKNECWVQVVTTGTSNAYIVNSKVLWRDHGGKRYASFYAEVVVSEDEQLNSIEQWMVWSCEQSQRFKAKSKCLSAMKRYRHQIRPIYCRQTP